MQYPKILFITPLAFNKFSGTGITFTNLFKNWPKDRIATVTGDRNPVTKDVCKKYFFLTNDELGFHKPFSFIIRKINHNQSKAFSPSDLNKESLTKKIKKGILGNAGVPEKGIMTQNLSDWIRSYKPDIIYTILGSLAYLDLVNQINNQFGSYLVVHVMDEGVIDPIKTGLFGPIKRKLFHKKLKNILKQSKLRFAICDAMAKEYSARYNMKFLHFQNTVDYKKWSPFCQEMNKEIKARIKIVYIGTIVSYAQAESLRDICIAVDKLFQEGMNIEINIYTQKIYRDNLKYKPTFESSLNFYDIPKSDKNFFKIISNSNIVVLPINFDERTKHFIRFSMPTKIPPYLICNVPIFVYGPIDVAQVEYAKKEGWGYIVDKKDPNLVLLKLKKLIQDNYLRAKLLKNANTLALKKHDINIVRKDFQNTLSFLK